MIAIRRGSSTPAVKYSYCLGQSNLLITVLRATCKFALLQIDHLADRASQQGPTFAHIAKSSPAAVRH